jgi:D-3-phosphoglycerate dehydrogenase / 2-oxoglutarate reductase
MAHVVITDSRMPPGVEEEVLRAAGLSVERHHRLTEDGVLEIARDADALIVQYAPITGRVLAGLPRLRYVGRLGIGYDGVDTDAASVHGVAVANVPDYCIEEVAAHALALLLALVRGIVGYDRSIRAGSWTQSAATAQRPSEVTLAVIGCGRTGARMARLATAVGFRVLANDPYLSDETIRATGARPVSFDEALAEADAVTLHVPLTRETRHLIDAAALARLRPTAVLVNTSRGAVVDQRALVEALNNGRLAGTGLDVLEEEPIPPDSPLLELENTVLTPHAAFYSPQSRAELPRRAAQQVVDFFAGRPVASIVNPR